MSENMNQNGQRQPTTPTPEASGGQGGERTFTQEEVNRIVADRLARERAKSEPSPADEREQALKAREAKLDCREYLDAQGYPAALLDVLDSSDTDKFKAAVDKLVKAFPAITGSGSTTPRQYVGWHPGERSAPKDGSGGPDPIRAAFKPKI